MAAVSIEDESSTRFLNSLCSLDADEVATQITEDACLSIGNNVFAAGRPRMLKALKRGIASLHSIHCRPAMIWARDNVSVIEADVSCERVDGSRASFPVTMILRFRDHLVSDIRLFTYEPAVAALF